MFPQTVWPVRTVASSFAVLLMLSSFGPALGADDGTVNEQQAAYPDLLAPPELEERLRVQDQLVDLENALRHDISGFGGLWRDHEGAIFVAATSDSMEATAHVVLRESPGDTTVELVEVQWTLDELLDARARIRAGIPKLTQQGVDVVSVAVDVRANVVEIAATASPAAIEADLSREYGPMVRAIPSVGIDPAACTGGDRPNPLKGGLNVNIGGENCSSGFVSRAGSSTSYCPLATAVSWVLPGPTAAPNTGPRSDAPITMGRLQTQLLPASPPGKKATSFIEAARRHSSV